MLNEIDKDGEYVLIAVDEEGNEQKFGNWSPMTDEELEIDYSPPKRVGFKKLSDSAIIPTKAHASDSGYDLYAAQDVIIEPGDTKVVPTNVAVVLPKGYEAQVRPRSGVTSRTKLRVQIGTIDNPYRGDIGIIVDNTNKEDDFSSFVAWNIGEELESIELSYMEGSYVINKGDKLAQLVVQELPNVEAYEVTGVLDDTERGDGGFGSTGVREGV